MSSGTNNYEVPIQFKTVLSVQECAALTGIGQNTLEAALSQDDCPFLLKVGRKRMIIRKAFDEYLEKYREIRTVSADDLKKNRFDFMFDSNNPQVLFPDRADTANVSVSAILSHVALKDFGDGRIDSSASDLLFDEANVDEEDRYSYHPENVICINDKDKPDDLVHVIKNEWNHAASEPDLPGGAYVVSDIPSHTLVIADATSNADEVVSLPLLDVWSREEIKSHLFIMDKDAHLFTRYSDVLKRRGFDVQVVNFASTNGTIGFNPYKPAIDALMNGNETAAVMFVEDLASAMFPLRPEGVSDEMVNLKHNLFAAISYALLIDAYDTANAVKDHHLEKRYSPDYIWSKVSFAGVYQMLCELSDVEFRFDDYHLNENDKENYFDGKASMNGVLLYCLYSSHRIRNCDLNHALNNSLAGMTTQWQVAPGSVPDYLHILRDSIRPYATPTLMHSFASNYSDSVDLSPVFVDGDGMVKPRALFVTYNSFQPNNKLIQKMIALMVHQSFLLSTNMASGKGPMSGTKYILDADSLISGQLNSYRVTDFLVGLERKQLFTVIASSAKIVDTFFGGAFSVCSNVVNLMYLHASDVETSDFVYNKLSKEPVFGPYRPLMSRREFNNYVLGDLIVFTTDGQLIVSRNDNTLPQAFSYFLHEGKDPELIFEKVCPERTNEPVTYSFKNGIVSAFECKANSNIKDEDVERYVLTGYDDEE